MLATATMLKCRITIRGVLAWHSALPRLLPHASHLRRAFTCRASEAANQDFSVLLFRMAFLLLLPSYDPLTSTHDFHPSLGCRGLLAVGASNSYMRNWWTR